MSANLTSTGESVYTAIPIGQRGDNSVYNTVAAILRDSEPGKILDIGASDGVANFAERLTESGSVVGLDITSAATEHNETELPIQGNALQLPFRDRSFSRILALDIIEHLTVKEARQALAEVQRVGTPDHRLIVSMPIISPTRVMTWVEGLRSVKEGQRPETGLFDRTHRILAGPLLHSWLFRGAGYETTAAYDTVAHTNGARRVKGADILPAAISDEGTSRQARLAQLYDAFQGSRTASSILGHAMAYQRLYVLRPEKPAGL